MLWATFFHGKSNGLIFTNYVLNNILRDFLQTHLATLARPEGK
jgi:hypothetical protein